MVYSDDILRQMIAEYVDGTDEATLLERYGMRKDKWSKVKNGSIRRLDGIEYPILTNAEKEERDEIAGWLSAGESVNRIAQELGISYSRVRRIAAELKAEGLTIERRKRAFGSLHQEDSVEKGAEAWDGWRYAYEECKAEWCANQRMFENVYKARGIPSQRMPFPLGWEDVQCRHSDFTTFKAAKQAIAQEVELWLQTLLDG